MVYKLCLNKTVKNIHFKNSTQTIKLAKVDGKGL